MTKVRLIIIFSLAFSTTFGQNKKIEITFIGNCGFFLTDGSLNLYIDFPYKSGAHNYMTYNSSILDSLNDHSVFLFTHGHSDHFNKKLFKKTHQKLYGPWPVRAFLSKNKKYTFQELNDSLKTFSVQKFRTKHVFTFQHYSYLIVWNSKRIFISGDAETADTICKIKNLDLVICPYWIIKDAQSRNLTLDTKQFILCHLRTNDPITTDNPEKIIIPKQNQKIELK
jgi:L-ascorbate metabolism protein UlaG (beta-lactamase superfamily)